MGFRVGVVEVTRVDRWRDAVDLGQHGGGCCLVLTDDSRHVVLGVRFVGVESVGIVQLEWKPSLLECELNASLTASSVQRFDPLGEHKKWRNNK